MSDIRTDNRARLDNRARVVPILAPTVEMFVSFCDEILENPANEIYLILLPIRGVKNRVQVMGKIGDC